MNKLMMLFVLSLLLSGCVVTKPMNKMEAYPQMYNEKPLSIVVAPAINNTTAADATALFSTTIAKPLAEAGFYVVPIPYVNQVLALEGIYDGAQIRSAPLQKFNHIFGADAVMFVTIEKWDTSYVLVSATVSVELKFELVSTKTNETLWKYQAEIVKDTSDSDSKNLLVKIISTAISTAVTDYVPIARKINWKILSTIPQGKYHPRYAMDGNDNSGLQKQVKR